MTDIPHAPTWSLLLSLADYTKPIKKLSERAQELNLTTNDYATMLLIKNGRVEGLGLAVRLGTTFPIFVEKSESELMRILIVK